MKPETIGLCNYTDQIVYSPKCMTSPYSGKITKEDVQKYIDANMSLCQQKFQKYAGVKVLGYRAHIMGMEDNVVGMAAPHNAVGVMCNLVSGTKPAPLWKLVMIAGYVRNTFLYHRKTLPQFLAMINIINEKRKVKGEETINYSAWERMVRPPWHAFTKEQRKRSIIILREWESYGDIKDDISDQDLADLVTKASADPEFLKKMADSKNADESRSNIYGSVSQSHMEKKTDSYQKKEKETDFFSSMAGDDLGGSSSPELPRKKMNFSSIIGTSFVNPSSTVPLSDGAPSFPLDAKILMSSTADPTGFVVTSSNVNPSGSNT